MSFIEQTNPIFTTEILVVYLHVLFLRHPVVNNVLDSSLSNSTSIAHGARLKYDNRNVNREVALRSWCIP